MVLKTIKKKKEPKSKKTAKILLVQPESTRQPHNGIMFISAVLKKADYKNIKFVAINDDYNRYERSSKYYKDLLKKGQDIVAITTATSTLKEAINCAKLAKKYKAITIFGGPGATDMQKELIENVSSLDYVFCGEAENRIVEFFDKILNKEDIRNVKGIAYRKNKKYAFTGAPELVIDLESLPYADRSILDFDSYMTPMTLVTSRGCPYNCSYCWKSIHGNKWRGRSPENVIKEIEYLIKNYDKELNKTNRVIAINDDNFNLDIKRAKEIIQKVIQKKFNIRLVSSNGFHVGSVDLELLKLLKKSGCNELWFGMESGNEKILTNLGKGINKDMIRRAVKLARKAGIKTVGGNFILGLPGETKQTAMDTINFAKELKLDLTRFNHLIILPNTRLWYWAEKNARFLYKIDKFDFRTYATNNTLPTFETKEFTEKERIECYSIALNLTNSLIKKRAFTLTNAIRFINKIKNLDNLKSSVKKLRTFIFGKNLAEVVYYAPLKKEENK